MAERADDSRLRVLRSTHLLGSPPEAAFDRLTRLAARLLGAPVALVGVVDHRSTFFKSAVGPNAPWAAREGTPRAKALCEYTTRDRVPFVVPDARENRLFRDDLAAPDFDVVAYAGIPLVVENEAIGVLCVIDDKPRVWSEDELGLLSELSLSVVSEIELRIATRKLRDQRSFTSALLENLADGVLAIDASRTFLVANAAARRMFHGAEAGQPMPRDWAALHRSIDLSGLPMAPEHGALGRGLRGENTDNLTFTLRGPNAVEPIWVEANGRPIHDAHGDVFAAVAIYRDVTEKKRQADLYSTLAQNIPRAAVVLFDRNLRCLAADGGLVRTAAIPLKDMIGKSLRELAGHAPDDKTYDRIDDVYRRTVAGQSLSIDFVLGEMTLALHTAPVLDGGGRAWAGIVLAQDVTAQRQTEGALRRSEQVYRAIVQNLPNAAVFMIDRDLRYVTADGPIVGDVLRRAHLEKIIGRSVTEVASGEHVAELLDMYRGALAGETRHREIQRADRFYDLSAVPIFEGAAPSHALIFLYDVTARKAELAELEKARGTLEQHAHELREASVTDELTGLLNRRGFMLIAEQEVRVATRNKTTLVLVFVDLNGMKKINDTFGHTMGDRALVDTGILLRKVFRNSDVIARLGGDEFVVLATNAVETSGPTFEGRLKEALAEYNSARTAPFRLSMSAGTALFDPSEPATLEKLLSDADARMYEEKQTRVMSMFPRVDIS